MIVSKVIHTQNKLQINIDLTLIKYLLADYF